MKNQLFYVKHAWFVPIWKSEGSFFKHCVGSRQLKECIHFKEYWCWQPIMLCRVKCWIHDWIVWVELHQHYWLCFQTLGWRVRQKITKIKKKNHFRWSILLTNLSMSLRLDVQECWARSSFMMDYFRCPSHMSHYAMSLHMSAWPQGRSEGLTADLNRISTALRSKLPGNKQINISLNLENLMWK